MDKNHMFLLTKVRFYDIMHMGIHTLIDENVE